MTQQEYVIKRKLNILELAETLGNVSEAARRSGVSRKETLLFLRGAST